MHKSDKHSQVVNMVLHCFCLHYSQLMKKDLKLTIGFSSLSDLVIHKKSLLSLFEVDIACKQFEKNGQISNGTLVQNP